MKANSWLAWRKSGAPKAAIWQGAPFAQWLLIFAFGSLLISSAWAWRLFPGYSHGALPGGDGREISTLFNLGNYRELSGLPSESDCRHTSGESFFERIIRGGAPLSRASFEYLRTRGVGAVLDLRTVTEVNAGSEPQWAEAHGIEYFNAPLTTTRNFAPSRCTPGELALGEATLANVRRAVAFLEDYLQAHPGKKVYVHCARGQDRTGIVLGALRLKADRCSSALVRQEMGSYFYTPYCNLNWAWQRLMQE